MCLQRGVIDQCKLFAVNLSTGMSSFDDEMHARHTLHETVAIGYVHNLVPLITFSDNINVLSGM